MAPATGFGAEEIPANSGIFKAPSRTRTCARFEKRVSKRQEQGDGVRLGDSPLPRRVGIGPMIRADHPNRGPKQVPRGGPTSHCRPPTPQGGRADPASQRNLASEGLIPTIGPQSWANGASYPEFAPITALICAASGPRRAENPVLACFGGFRRCSVGVIVRKL